MKMSSAVIALICATSGAASAAPRDACGVLSLAEVRSLVGAPVSVFDASSSAPTTRGDATVSTCTYVSMDANGHVAKGRGAKFTLMWASDARLAETNAYYVKRHKEAPGLKGNVLVVAWVGNQSDADWSASQRLLAAVLKNL